MNKEKIEKYVFYTGLVGLIIGIFTADFSLDIVDLIALAVYYFADRLPLPAYVKWFLKYVGLGVMLIVTIVIVVIALLIIFLVIGAFA